MFQLLVRPTYRILPPTSQLGFTLVELLVVIFIITLLAAIITPGYASQARALRLERSAQLVAQHLRQAAEFALSSAEVGPRGAAIIPSGGYGISFTPANTIFLFVDCNNTGRYEATPSNLCGLPGSKFDEDKFLNNTRQSVTLEPGVIIQSMSHSPPLDIVFRPPIPTVLFNNLTVGEATIVLELQGSSRTKTVKVNRAGVISIE